MASENKKLTLTGNKAIVLRLKGKDAWNKWVEKQPIADIDFKDVDFRNYRDHPLVENEHWPFAGFNFPTGVVDFSGATFGDGNVDFSGATFGDGNVKFTNAMFGEGYVDFFQTTFGDGNVSFSGATFGVGDVNFFGATFGVGNVNLERINFKGRVDFSDLQNVGVIKSFSFAHSAFESTLEISSDEAFGCAVDLTRTKTTNQISLEGLACKLRKKKDPSLVRLINKFLSKGLKRWVYRPLTRCVFASEWLTKAKARDVSDIERFRRLKEIAGDNKNHDQALNFNVMEMQAKRWHKTTKAGLVFEFIFQKTSDYGRSEFRPVMWMIFLLLFCGALYCWMSDKVVESTSDKFWTSLTFSLGQMVSFVPISRDARSDGAEILFPVEQLPNSVIWLASFQSLASIILIFLIGLSLRNRFKV